MVEPPAPPAAGQGRGLLAWLEGLAWADRSLYRLPLRIGCIVVREFAANAVSMRAAALTYAIVLSLVPLLALSTATLKGLGGDDRLRELAELWLEKLETSTSAGQQPHVTMDDTAVPAPPADGVARPEVQVTITGHLREAVETVFAYVARTNFATLGIVGVLGVLLTVLIVLGQIEGAMNVIWHGVRGRPLLRRLLDYLAMLVLLPLAVNVALATGTILANPTWAGSFAGLMPFTWVLRVGLTLLPLAFVVLALLVLYLFFPNVPVRTGPALTASLVAGLAWLLLQKLYLMLQLVVANYNAIYGSFATLPLFLLWLFLGWNVILGGAVLAHAIQHQERFRPREEEPSPVRRLQLAYDLLAELYRCFGVRRACTMEELVRRLPAVDQRDLLLVSTMLQRGGLLRGSLREPGGIQPAAPQEELGTEEVLRLVLGEDAAPGPGGELSGRILTAAAAEARCHPLPGSQSWVNGGGDDV
ncbi:MAG: hypothetical protein BWK76_10255 [Desulfobulbaceae bacterium A2]|nr:MAG: hypothetical protein BWK76_10255 [Desulfobulbaceae bacterium A2]